LNNGALTVRNTTFSGNTADPFLIGGGAISNIGTLTVNNSTFSGNSALGLEGGAIPNVTGATLSVSNSTFSGNNAHLGGGAISNAGRLTLANSTFSGNNAINGGAIEISTGTVTVTKSTLSGNSGSDNGGAIAIVTGDSLTVTNSTFSGNSAGNVGGAILNESATLTVTNSTFSGNSAPGRSGGAIWNGGAVTFINSVLANSTSGGNCSVSNPSTTPITDGGHNIDDGTTCGFTGSGCATTGTSFCNTNPLLDPTGLASNGGPTQTIALEAGSPAINTGDETVCAAPPVNNLDQRGFVRPGAGATNCSIGAYEFNAAPPGRSGDRRCPRHQYPRDVRGRGSGRDVRGQRRDVLNARALRRKICCTSTTTTTTTTSSSTSSGVSIDGRFLLVQTRGAKINFFCTPADLTGMEANSRATTTVQIAAVDSDTRPVAMIASGNVTLLGVGKSTVTADPASVPADKTSTSTLSVSVRDGDGNPVPDGTPIGLTAAPLYARTSAGGSIIDGTTSAGDGRVRLFTTLGGGFVATYRAPGARGSGAAVIQILTVDAQGRPTSIAGATTVDLS